ncbi:hypothetical protein HMPREF3226_01850 [Prevotella corporis]|uniref:Uncharacterized protein n=1 Tax=Prevotella corporis TaxID=28128 RepID=A0A133Q1V5_9BACT|nr:hypothetical protein HMPREF3226_01850 [Prevotella corporis]
MICLKIRTFAVATTTNVNYEGGGEGCDLLENSYLCGSNNNHAAGIRPPLPVVICLKIRTFAVATTTTLSA